MRLDATPRLARASLLAIAVLWAASLALPAVQLTSSGRAYSGFELLLQGWSGTRAGLYAWYANPAFLIAVLLGATGRARAAGVLSGVAFVLGLTSLAAEPIARAAGTPLPAWTWRAGFFVWLLALAALCAWSWAYVVCERRPRHRTR